MASWLAYRSSVRPTVHACWQADADAYSSLDGEGGAPGRRGRGTRGGGGQASQCVDLHSAVGGDAHAPLLLEPLCMDDGAQIASSV